MQSDAVKIVDPISMDFKTGLLGKDPRIERGAKTIGQLGDVFLDENARSEISPATAVYAVEYWKPVPDGIEGGLFWGNSTIFPGMVGDEYFMTRGHFHVRIDRAEFYSTISGSGVLVLMDQQRNAVVQEMHVGTTHYVPGRIAHRVVNTGDLPLILLACWPSDAGHDYATIDEHGFSVRILRRNGRPEVIRQ